MRFRITGGFTYLTTHGEQRFVGPKYYPETDDILDTTVAWWAIPPDWLPPVIGVEALDGEAKALLDLARAPYVGKGQLPGIGIIPPP